jgi:hypothetical protein
VCANRTATQHLPLPESVCDPASTNYLMNAGGSLLKKPYMVNTFLLGFCAKNPLQTAVNCWRLFF